MIRASSQRMADASSSFAIAVKEGPDYVYTFTHLSLPSSYNENLVYATFPPVYSRR